MANKIYRIYPTGTGFSNNTVDYHGAYYSVAAANSRQAHVLARRDIWATGEAAIPQGIVSIYRKSWGEPGDRLLWCGCRNYWGIGLAHLAGVRAIRNAMQQHLDEVHTTD